MLPTIAASHAVGEEHKLTNDAARVQWLARNILPHEGQVRAWLHRHVRTISAADVDDLIQEAYVRLWSLDVDTIDNGRAYFFTIVRNLILEQARRARVIPMERMEEIDALSIVSEQPEPERQASAREQLEKLGHILNTLPPKCRRVFELRKFEGLSIRETAKTMRISEGTVEKHLAKALARILETVGKSEARSETTVAENRGEADAH